MNVAMIRPETSFHLHTKCLSWSHNFNCKYGEVTSIQLRRVRLKKCPYNQHYQHCSHIYGHLTGKYLNSFFLFLKRFISYYSDGKLYVYVQSTVYRSWVNLHPHDIQTCAMSLNVSLKNNMFGCFCLYCQNIICLGSYNFSLEFHLLSF